VVYWSEKYAKKARTEREETIKRALDIIDNPKNHNKNTAHGAAAYIKNIAFDKKTGEIYEKPGKMLLFDEEKAAEDAKYDGYYCILTSELEMPQERVIEIYRGLSDIEDNFKVSKSDLDINPVYVSLTDKLSDREASLAEKTASLEAMQVTSARLQGNLNTLQAELSAKQINQQQLQNEINRLEETQNLLAQKLTQTQIARSIDLGGTTMNIASPALVPANPVKPNKKLNVAVALVLGLMVAMGLAFLLEFMDSTIKTPDDVEKHLGLPVIGSIPASVATARKSRWSFGRYKKT